MNRLLSVAAIAVVTTATSAFAGTVNINTSPGAPWEGTATANGGRGGGFRVTQATGFNGVLGGRGGTANSFISFCIEVNEFLGGNPHSTQIATSAAGGGVGGAVNGEDPLGAVTAVLYYEFRTGGTFNGAAPLGTDAASWTTALTNALQRAIWASEQEIGNFGNGITAADFQNDTTALAMYNWAAAQVTGTTTLAQAAIAKVRVLRTFTNAGVNSQDLLTIIPLSTAGGLAMAGLLGCGMTRRRFN